MSKVAKSYPSGSQLVSNQNANDNKAVSNSSNQNNKNRLEGGKQSEIGSVGDNRQKLDTLGYPASRPTPAKRFLALNESGTQRIGEDHPRAKLSDAEVEAIRDEYEAGQEGTGPYIGYRLLAKKYGVGKRTIRDIVNYRKRNQWAGSWKKVP